MIDESAVKVACAIGVAAGIYQDIQKDKNDAHKLKRLKLASDAVDRTIPLASFYSVYQNKPQGMADGPFLLQHLHLLCLQPEDLWPQPKVKPRDWGEYTRVMRGLDVFLRADLEAPAIAKSAAGDVIGMLRFLGKIRSQLSTAMQERLAHLAERFEQLSR